VQDRVKHSVHQLVIANSALVASEADAFLTLASTGLEGPAQIHQRAVGEMTGRVILCREHPELALQLYESAEPTWRKLASGLPIEDAPIFEKGERDMRSIERTEEYKNARNEIVARAHLMDEFELTMLSKRNHGDIFALVQVSQNLRGRGTDVRRPISQTMPAGIAVNSGLSRVTGFVITCLSHIIDEFGIDTTGRLESIYHKQSIAMQRDAESGALNVPSLQTK
jgi:hypothetical protein